MAHEWHARAALWAGDWRRATQAIEAMPESLRSQNRWRYWAARAREAAGDGDAARAGYATVMPTDNWYAVLSAARLGERFAPTLQEIELDKRAIDELAREPGFLRTRELLLCDLPSEAATEWRIAYELLAPAQQVQAIGLADRWGWHHQSIAAAAQQTLYNDYPLLYPRPYDKEVRAAARLTDLPEELIYAVIRQESLYRADAGSSAGALGLMQLLPSTARRAARRWGLKEPARADLLRPSVNVPIGAGELKSLLDRFDGQTLLATAAYNAGPGAVQRWLPAIAMDDDIWVENIPFNETRTYVQRVAWHSLVFAWLDDRKATRRDLMAWSTDGRNAGYRCRSKHDEQESDAVGCRGYLRLHGRGDRIRVESTTPSRDLRRIARSPECCDLTKRSDACIGSLRSFGNQHRGIRRRNRRRASNDRPRRREQAADAQLGDRSGPAGGGKCHARLRREREQAARV